MEKPTLRLCARPFAAAILSSLILSACAGAPSNAGAARPEERADTDQPGDELDPVFGTATEAVHRFCRRLVEANHFRSVACIPLVQIGFDDKEAKVSELGVQLADRIANVLAAMSDGEKKFACLGVSELEVRLEQVRLSRLAL